MARISLSLVVVVAATAASFLQCSKAVAQSEQRSPRDTTAISALNKSVVVPANLPESIASWCGHLSAELLSVNLERCLQHPWKSDLNSPGSRPIPYLYWGKEDGPDVEKVLVLGAMHGDEITAVSVVFRWIDFLDRTKPDSFLRQKRYLFFPLVNPDGFYIKPRTRTNSNGVDVNRNFATKEWNQKALLYWKKKAHSDKRRFPGQKPASEIETQLVQKAIDDFKPSLIISVHAPYKVVDHDGPIVFPNIKSPLPVRTLGAFPGSLGTYAGVDRGVPVVTPELPSATQLPDIKAVEQLFVFIMKAEY